MVNKKDYILAIFLESLEASFLAESVVIRCEWEMAEKGKINSSLQ